MARRSNKKANETQSEMAIENVADQAVEEKEGETKMADEQIVEVVETEEPVASESEIAEAVEAAKESEPVAETEETEAAEGETEQVTGKCRVCGKTLTAEQSVVRGIGPVCQAAVQKYLPEGTELKDADETVLNAAIEKAKTEKPNQADEVPVVKATKEGEEDRPFVSVAKMHNYCNSQEIPVSWMVRAIGGDRGTNAPLNEKWTPIYVGRTRYIHPDCMTEAGIEELKAAYKKEPKPKKADQPAVETEQAPAETAEAPKETEATAEATEPETVEVEEIQ